MLTSCRNVLYRYLRFLFGLVKHLNKNLNAKIVTYPLSWDSRSRGPLPTFVGQKGWIWVQVQSLSVITKWFFFIFMRMKLIFKWIYDRRSGNCNRPFPSSPGPLYQNEVRCLTFLVEMNFICMRMKNHFHIKGWAPNIVLIQRPGGTRKWPILAAAN